MIFRQHYSGSKANLYTVESSAGGRLMIECGVRWKDIQRALDYNLRGIEGCLVSHSHADHSTAVRDVARAGIDVYMSHGTFEALGLEGVRRIGVVPENTLIRLKSFDVLTFGVNHDCDGAFGFVIREKATGDFMLFATDTSHLTQRFMYAFSIVALECSYDLKTLQARVDAGDINESLAKRLLTSHFEKDNLINYLADSVDLSRCTEIHLLHLSSDNIHREITVKEIMDRFMITTRTVGDGLQR